MAALPPAESAEKLATAARAVQLATLVKENQLITALILFCLWQVGAFYSAQQYAAGVVC